MSAVIQDAYIAGAQGVDAGPVARLLSSDPPSSETLLRLLTARGDDQEALFAAARRARADAGMQNVKLRGVVEISSYCQKSCAYCAIRPQNKVLERYRMDADMVCEIAQGILTEGISTVFLQAGQESKCDPIALEALPRLRSMGANILLNLGEKSRENYQRYAAAGADSYILKFETSDPVLYQEIVGTPLARRMECADWIREAGMRLGTGNIVGLPGQTIESLAADILLALKMRPNFVSSSPFIPNENTPFEDEPTGDLDLTLNTLAIYRILMPTTLIPSVSALEKIRKGGQLRGLMAGANVMTVNFTPKELRDKYAIYSKERFVVGLEHARKTAREAGLQLL